MYKKLEKDSPVQFLLIFSKLDKVLYSINKGNLLDNKFTGKVRRRILKSCCSLAENLAEKICYF